MNIKFIEIMSVAEKLKNNTRHSRTSSVLWRSGTQLAAVFDSISRRMSFLMLISIK